MYYPEEFMHLKKDPLFMTIPDDELFSYYNQFKVVSNGEMFVNRESFQKILLSLNIYSTPPITKRLYDKIDSNSSEKIEFLEFMRFFLLILSGTKEQKEEFIFKFICKDGNSFFSLTDLVDFYSLLNYN